MPTRRGSARPWHWVSKSPATTRHRPSTRTTIGDTELGVERFTDAWTAEPADTRRAVAAGTTQPAQARAITSGRDGVDPKLEARLREIGSCIPPAARAALAPYRPARAAREAAVAQGLPDALSVRCEWCLAQPFEPCRRRRIGPDGGARGTAPRATPHPGRLHLAATEQAQRAEQAQQPALA